MAGCTGFSTCYGFGCGGGAIEQTLLGYGGTPPGDAGRGLHPKCQIVPDAMTFEVGGWHGDIGLVGAGYEFLEEIMGCADPAPCSGQYCDTCQITDMAGNVVSGGDVTKEECEKHGFCITPDMTIKGCCEDPYTGAKPDVDVGFGTGLDKKECECRGGTWSRKCLDYAGNEQIFPKCTACGANACNIFHGTTNHTAGPPVLFDQYGGYGYGITNPWEITLACIAPALTAHGHLSGDYGAWVLKAVAYVPDPGNKLGSLECETYTFTNNHGDDSGGLKINSMCEGGSWEITADIPAGSNETVAGCGKGCPCGDQVNDIAVGEKCDCNKPDCVTDGFECLHGTENPPDCDASCFDTSPACPQHNVGDAGKCQDSAGNILGTLVDACDALVCGACGIHCEDGCVCTKADAIVGPSSRCGITAMSWRNTGGHGCSRDPKLTNQGQPDEGKCCKYYGPEGTCIDESYYECGCLSEAEAAAGVTITIKANGQYGPTVTKVGGYENNDGSTDAPATTPVGGNDPGTIINECPAVDAICDQQKKYPDTDGCRYTKWPDSSCVTPLPPPDIREGIRCPNSLVWEQPTYGMQCTLPGGSNNGVGNLDFPVKPGGCLNARYERWHLRPQFNYPQWWAICHKTGFGESPPPCDEPADRDAECVEHPEVTRFVADLGNIHGPIGECNIYCEGWWEVVVDCFRAWTLDLCLACMGDCWEDRKLLDPSLTPFTGGMCDESDVSGDRGCDGKWPGIFPFLYYHPPIPEFCPYGEYWPAIGCPTVPGSPAADMHGVYGSSQLFYPGNINTRWSGCCGNQPPGCECCYPCGHPAWDPECRVRALVQGNICDMCWECQCETSSHDQGFANQIFDKNDCPNGCVQASTGMNTGQCRQVVQDGGNEVAGCGQFMQEMPDGQCPAPIYCPEGLIPYDKYGGGFCIEGDFCCSCLREKGYWEQRHPVTGQAMQMLGPDTNPLGWKLGAPVLYDMAWYPLKEAVCMLEPCGMGTANEGLLGFTQAGAPILIDKGAIKVSTTLMNPGTHTPVGTAEEFYDHQSRGDIIGVTGHGQPIKITTRLQVGQLQVRLSPGDPVFIGSVNDTNGVAFGSQVGGNLAANGAFTVLAVSGNEFTIAHPGGGPVIGTGTYTDGGTWHHYDANDPAASCIGPSQQCAFDFKYLQGGTNVGTPPKILSENIFVQCIEEAFTEWSNILESLWSPHADYTATSWRTGGWASSTQSPFPGSHNINPGHAELTSSHQLRARFINLGYEPPLSNEVPSNKKDRYNSPEWSRITSWPEIGNCRTAGGRGGYHASPYGVPEKQWKNQAECVTHGHCLKQECSANDQRANVKRGASCAYGANPSFGTSYTTAQDCLSATYYACLTHPKAEIEHYVPGADFGMPLDSDGDDIADKFPYSHWRFPYIDPKYVMEDIGDKRCCIAEDGYWEEIPGDWSTDWGNGSGIFNPGHNELFPCVPKDAGCCQGTLACTTPGGDQFIPPTNTYVPSTCCKEYEERYGQCLGDYNSDGDMDLLAGCDYDCCGYGEAGWCVAHHAFNNIYWDSVSCPSSGGMKACREGAESTGCLETLYTCPLYSQRCGPVKWQATQRVLKHNISAGDSSLMVDLRFGNASNVGDPIEKPSCDGGTAQLFEIDDYIKIGVEYMKIDGINVTNNTISVIRGFTIPEADPTSTPAAGHGAGDSISLWSSDLNCDHIAHCQDGDGNLIGDANNGVGYFPIDNRALYHLCRDGVKVSPYPDTCGADGGCWIGGEAGTGSSRGVPIGISSLLDWIGQNETTLTITEIDNTGNLFRDAGNDRHNPSAIARPEPFTLKPGDIIRIESEDMKILSVTTTSSVHPDVKGFCTGDVNLNGVPNGDSDRVPECSFDDCDGNRADTACRHWFDTVPPDPGGGGGGSDPAENCAGELLGDRSWPNNIVLLHEIVVERGYDDTNQTDHDANLWIRKKYTDVILDCHQCDQNLMGLYAGNRHVWVGGPPGNFSNPPGSVWRGAYWYPDFDWQANVWDATAEYDVPFRGKTGGECPEWPDRDQCCPRIGQVRIGMVNWWDALRERWAAEGKGQCYDCSTGVIIGNQTKFGPNSVELHGECLRYNEDRYNKLLIGSTSDSQADCLALNCQSPQVNDCDGVCSDTSYTTKTDCISNNKVWATWDWSAYMNKDICNNAGHCWDYRDPPLVPASGNPFACGYMGSMDCRKNVDGNWVPCLPEAGKPYALANNSQTGASCAGFGAIDQNPPPIGAPPPGGLAPDPGDGGETCICITRGKEGIAGDLYIDTSVKWRPDWVPESDKPGAFSIKRVLMKQIGHMLGLPTAPGGPLLPSIMSPITGPADDAKTVDPSTYNMLVRMYEPAWWKKTGGIPRGGKNDYWWVSGVYAGDFK